LFTVVGIQARADQTVQNIWCNGPFIENGNGSGGWVADVELTTLEDFSRSVSITYHRVHGNDGNGIETPWSKPFVGASPDTDGPIQIISGVRQFDLSADYTTMLISGASQNPIPIDQPAVFVPPTMLVTKLQATSRFA
jgi:hypothetical protein